MSKRNTTILVADDDPDLLSITAKLLQACGYTVVTAEDGEAALEAFKQAKRTIQLVISDVVMPRMLGPQLLRSIRGISPSTPMLLMSGTWSSVTEDGVTLMPKPFTQQKLVAIVEHMLSNCDFRKIEREQSLARSRRPSVMAGAGDPHTRDSLATD